MNTVRLATVGCALALAASSAMAAEISGVVTLQGDPPAADRPIRTTMDARCEHSGSFTTENWKLGPNHELAEVVVSVKNAPPGSSSPAAPPKRLIDQVRCQFVPHVIALEKNGTLTIRNSDATLHNVRGTEILGPRETKNLFNFGQASAGATADKSFAAPGVYTLNCDVHPWMQAWVRVLDSSLFAVTDAAGAFQISGALPDGEYTLEAWHPRFERATEQRVKIENGAAQVAIVLDAAQAH